MNKTRFIKKNEKTTLQRKQDRKGKFYYRLFIICVIAFIVSYWFQPLTIGNDIRHTIFIVLLPIFTGLTVFIIYRKKLLDANAVAAVTNKWHKLGYSIVILGCATLLSYITLGFITNAVWQYTNYSSAKNQKQQIVTLPVYEFHEASGGRHSSNMIYFFFQGNKEHIKVRRDLIQQYKSNTKHLIQLKIRKGLWNHYLVDDWEIIK